jgi:hypothetical protein
MASLTRRVVLDRVANVPPIRFGGPPYPRGFARLGAGQREHWETPPEFAVGAGGIRSYVRERGPA